MSLTKIGSIGINTGIQLAGVTTVAEFHVGAGSSVGIGTIAPDTPLHIRSSDTGKLITLSGGTPRSNYFGIKDADNLEIAADEDDEGPSSSIRFRIDGSEVARIHHAGRLGIGTDSPLAELHLVADNPNIEFNDVNTLSNGEITLDNTQLRIEVDEDNAVDSSAIAFRVDGSDQVTIDSSGDLTIKDKIIHSGDTNTAIRFPAADTITAETGGSERVRIDSNGRLGIGTATANAKLHILHSESSDEPGILLEDASTSSGAPYLEIIGKRSDGNIHQSFSGQVYLSRNRTAQKVSSNLKLGTILFGGNHTDGSKSNILYAASIAGVSGDDFDSATDMPTDLVFYTGSTGRSPGVNNVSSGDERLRITSAGKILVGDTTARGFDGGNTPQLQVASSTSGEWARMSSATYIDSTIGGGIILAHSRNATIGSHTIVQDDDKLGSIFFEGSDGSAFKRGAQIQAYVDGTPGSDDMPGRIEFSTSADGSSSPTVRATLLSNGSFVVGNTSSGLLVGSSSAAKLQVKHTTGNISAAFYSTANASGPAGILALGHARDTVSGVLQEDDVMGEIRFAGGDGNDLQSIGARIKCEVDNPPGSNDMPGSLIFGTTADGSASPTDHLKLNRNGILSFLNAGDGISFPNGHSVTPNNLEAVLSNTLDDFESGDLDWEIHKDNGLTTGTNASGAHAKYVKIGPVVHIFGWIRTDGQTSTNNRTAVMTDASGNRAQLPFTPNGTVHIPVNFTRAFQNSTTLSFCLGATHAIDDVYIHGNQSNNYTPGSDNCALTSQTNLVIAFNGSYYTND